MPKKLSVLHSASKYLHGEFNGLITRKPTRNYNKNGMSKKVLNELLAAKKFYRSVHERALKCLNSNDSWSKKYNMAVEFDQLYIDSDGKSTIPQNLKLQGLKELNLLHLDLIQHQSDQIHERDKIIKALKQENEGLKVCLEHLEHKLALEEERCSIISSSTTRRVKDSKEHGNNKWEQKIAEKTVLYPAVITNAKSDSITHGAEKKNSKKGSRQLSPLENRNRINSHKCTMPAKSYEQVCAHVADCEERMDAVECLDIESNLSGGKNHQNLHHSLRSQNRDSTCSATDNSKQRSSENPQFLSTASESPSCVAVKNFPGGDLSGQHQDPFLTTDVTYFISSPVRCYEPLIPKSECEQLQVEIPKWHVRSLSTLYVMEGTENLEDEIFMKRHSKPESEERKRKRWDLQRMREQRQYEKLKERYEERNNLSESNIGNHCSLWPPPESARYIQIEQCLPVCAFGQQLPIVKPSDFSLPWSHNGKKRRLR